jgi:hypothetical protein
MITGEEFDEFVQKCNVPQQQVDESAGQLTYAEFVEYKITGKLKNVKVNCVKPISLIFIEKSDCALLLSFFFL